MGRISNVLKKIETSDYNKDGLKIVSDLKKFINTYGQDIRFHDEYPVIQKAINLLQDILSRKAGDIKYSYYALPNGYKLPQLEYYPIYAENGDKVTINYLPSESAWFGTYSDNVDTTYFVTSTYSSPFECFEEVLSEAFDKELLPEYGTEDRNALINNKDKTEEILKKVAEYPYDKEKMDGYVS